MPILAELDPVMPVRHFAKHVAKISIQTIYEEINENRLKTFTIGRRRYVTDSAAREWFALLEQEETERRNAEKTGGAA